MMIHIANVRLWRTFTIDYDYDYMSAAERRHDVQMRCKALTRKPARAQYVKFLVVQWDGPLGSHFGRSARSTCKLICKSLIALERLEALKVG